MQKNHIDHISEKNKFDSFLKYYNSKLHYRHDKIVIKNKLLAIPTSY